MFTRAAKQICYRRNERQLGEMCDMNKTERMCNFNTKLIRVETSYTMINARQ